ncbi:MAG: hypothetical protein QM673_04465 [Gordonia sp. (in: high G+C Gram-positive bacteria)]
MTVLTQSYESPGRPARVRTVEVAGILWPLYKLHAVAAALLAALITLSVTRDPQITAWVSGVVLISVWWVERYLHVVSGRH